MSLVLRRSLAFFLLALAPAAALAGEEPDYAEMHGKLRALYAEGRYEEGLNLLLATKDAFIREHTMATTFNLGLFHFLAGQHEPGLAAWEEGIEDGVWFTIDPGWEFLEPIAKSPRLARIMEISEKRRRKAQEHAHPVVDVKLPEGFDANRRYPLFIALHGGEGSNRMMREWWHSALLERDYVVAYVQSSQFGRSQGRFVWNDEELARQEVVEQFFRLLDKYPIAVDRVVIGGYSQGGHIALRLALSDVLPIAGFVVLSPHGKLVHDFSACSAEKAAKRGVRGAMIVRKHDPAYEAQSVLAETLSKAGLPTQLDLIKLDASLEPVDFSQRLDSALMFMFP